MPTSSIIATALMLSGTVLGDALTTIVPTCSLPNITVTEQHQTVTDCGPSGSPTTSVWVSTVIPCYGGENTTSSCTVTTTDQPVPCSATVTASTHTTSPTPTAIAERDDWESWSNGTDDGSFTWIEVFSKEYLAPYNKLGPLAIPDYEGCDLCTDCGVLSDGSQQQEIYVLECEGPSDGEPTCTQYEETWISLPVPSSTGAVYAQVSSQTSCPYAGDYTFTFPQPAPTATLTAGGQEYDAPADSWDAIVTTHVDGATIIDFTVIITQIVTFNVPYATGSANGNGYGGYGGGNNGGNGGGYGGGYGGNNGGNGGGYGGGYGGNGGGYGGNGGGDDGNDGNGNGGNWGGWAAPTTQSYDPTYPTPPVTATPGNGWNNWGASSTVSSSTYTSSSSTSTTSGPPEPTESFYLEVTIFGAKRRRASCVLGRGAYLGFDDDDTLASIAAVTPGLFYFDGAGFLKFGDEFIQEGNPNGYFAMERGPTQPPEVVWFLAEGVLSYEASSGFCAAADNSFIVEFDGLRPSACKQAYASSTSVSGGICTSTSSSSSTATSTSSSSTITTTSSTTADTSGDMNAEPTTSTGSPRRRGLQLKHY